MTRINVDDLKSIFETTVYKNLQALKKKFKYDFDYEPDSLQYIVEHWYKPDWKVERQDGSSFYIESKGYWRPDERSMLLKIKKQHPGIDIRMLFQNNPKIHKNSPSRYSDWCERHNIPYAIKEIPEEWLS